MPASRRTAERRRRGLRAAWLWLGLAASHLVGGESPNMAGADPVNVAETLAGRRIPTPPVAGPAGFRLRPPDVVEQQLRAFYRQMGGPHWRHNHGWRDEQSQAPPPPSAGNGTAAGLQETVDAVWQHVSRPLLRPPLPLNC